MRITVVIGGLMGGGAERVCINLANAWAARGWQVTILTLSQRVTPAYAIDSRVRRCNLGWPRPPNSAELNATAIAPTLRTIDRIECPRLIGEIGLFAILRHAILSSKPDVVVSHLDLTNIRVLAAMPETGVPVIACEHTDVTQFSIGIWQRPRQALYRLASAVVAPHPAIAQWLAQDGARAYAIPNPLVGPTALRAKSGGGRRRLVTLTRLSEEKRIELLLRAFASIAADFPEWDLEVYGDGPLRDSLNWLAGRLAPGRIQLRGFVRGEYEILAGADLFVSASWIEGFGNAIWEALACGVPVVAMECGAAVRSLVRHGVDGLIVGDDSHDGLASALASLMSNDTKREGFAERASEVVTRFSLEASLQAWDRLLEEVVGIPARSHGAVAIV